MLTLISIAQRTTRRYDGGDSKGWRHLHSLLLMNDWVDTL
jgi:hypothetical protein